MFVYSPHRQVIFPDELADAGVRTIGLVWQFKIGTAGVDPMSALRSLSLQSTIGDEFLRVVIYLQLLIDDFLTIRLHVFAG